MRIVVLHDVFHVRAGVVEDEVVASGMVSDEGGDIVDLSLERDPAALRRLVRVEVLEGKDADAFRNGHGRRRRRVVNLKLFWQSDHFSSSHAHSAYWHRLHFLRTPPPQNVLHHFTARSLWQFLRVHALPDEPYPRRYILQHVRVSATKITDDMYIPAGSGCLGQLDKLPPWTSSCLARVAPMLRRLRRTFRLGLPPPLLLL
jgi:hypothetical protein